MIIMPIPFPSPFNVQSLYYFMISYRTNFQLHKRCVKPPQLIAEGATNPQGFRRRQIDRQLFQLLSQPNLPWLSILFSKWPTVKHSKTSCAISIPVNALRPVIMSTNDGVAQLIFRRTMTIIPLLRHHVFHTSKWNSADCNRNISDGFRYCLPRMTMHCLTSSFPRAC